MCRYPFFTGQVYFTLAPHANLQIQATAEYDAANCERRGDGRWGALTSAAAAAAPSQARMHLNLGSIGRKLSGRFHSAQPSMQNGRTFAQRDAPFVTRGRARAPPNMFHTLPENEFRHSGALLRITEFHAAS